MWTWRTLRVSQRVSERMKGLGHTHMHMDKCMSEDTRLTHSIHMAPKYLSYVED